jgi:3-phosphoshikimate 1-carboxyvinyltransferase
MTAPAQLKIKPFAKPALGSIRPPGSKSITNRALVCAALARGNSELTGALVSDDTRVMIDALHALGIPVREVEGGTRLFVNGCAGIIPVDVAELFVGNSGTTMRFLTAMLAAGKGRFTLDGVPRMRERPIRDLLDTLSQLGCHATSVFGNGCPPVVLEADGLPGGQATIRGDVSSQFLSGLLMAAPYARSPIRLSITGELVSQPYVRITLAVMKAFGIDVPGDALSSFQIAAPCVYAARAYAIEPDASAASYFWAAAAITGGKVTVEGLSQHSLQGDVAFCDCLRQMGCEVHSDGNATTVVGRPLHGIDVNMNAISDTVQTLAAIAAFAKGPTTIRGVGHIRHKETDRIRALATEMRKLGQTVEETDDGLRIIPAPVRAAAIDTYDDHRMAMSLALVGLRAPGIVINDPGCTAKTYPNYFKDLEELRGK